MSNGSDSQPSQGSEPLSGVRVLDFSHILAGPFCTRMLADFGADVVKVETRTRPDRTSVTRSSSDKADDKKRRQDRPPSYLNTNRNKRSITINLKSDSGRELATRMATVADVIVENFSAGVMTRLQLDYDHLQPLNPGLIYVSMSGYGHSGPRQAWTSMNMNLQAYTGLMMVTGAEGDPPTAISNSWNDYIGGLHACFGIIQCLSERARTGVGANLDLAQAECSVATFGPLLLHSLVTQNVPPRLGNRSMQEVPQGCYRCTGSDEWCAISVQNDTQWRSLVTVMGNPSWASNPRFSTMQGRLDNHDELDTHIESWTCQLSNTEVERRLKDAGVAAERMRRIKEVVEAPDRAQVFQPLEDPRGGTYLATGIPFTFTASSLSPLRPAPALGEHTTEAITDWLGLTDTEIGNLQEQGVLV